MLSQASAPSVPADALLAAVPPSCSRHAHASSAGHTRSPRRAARRVLLRIPYSAQRQMFCMRRWTWLTISHTPLTVAPMRHTCRLPLAVGIAATLALSVHARPQDQDQSQDGFRFKHRGRAHQRDGHGHRRRRAVRRRGRSRPISRSTKTASRSRSPTSAPSASRSAWASSWTRAPACRATRWPPPAPRSIGSCSTCSARTTRCSSTGSTMRRGSSRDGRRTCRR